MDNPDLLTLQRVDFGQIDAESDVKLQQYFVDTGVLKRLSEGDKQLVVGRKGSGKTALFQQSQKTLPNTLPLMLEFSDYAWEQHKAIKELGLPAENAYTASWTFTYLIAACNAWKKSANPNVSGPAQQSFDKIFGAAEVEGIDILVDKLRRLRKLELPNAGDVGGLGGFELDEAKKEGAQLARAANYWNQQLLELADKLFPIAPFTILIDRLDDGWDATQQMKDMLAGAIKAARSLNFRFARDRRPKAVIVFLRSDIFAELAFNDKNKIGAAIEYLEWDDAELLSVAEERIAKSLGIPRVQAWNKIFSPEQMRQKAFISSYLLKRTMQRPRDIIAFCGYCKEAAIKAQHPIVETADVYEAEQAYSRHIFDELVDEMHKQVPNHGALFNSLRLVGYTRFRMENWLQAERRQNQQMVDQEAGERLKTLFDFGVVGVPKVGGRGGGSSFEFAYQDRYLPPAFDGEVVAHPALRKHLNLTDATAPLAAKG